MSDALATFASRFDTPGGNGGGTVGSVPVCLPSLTGSSDAFLALCLTHVRDGKPRPVLAITPGVPDADRLTDDLRLLTRDKTLGTVPYGTRILEFPPLLDGDKAALATRLKTIAAIKAWGLSPYP